MFKGLRNEIVRLNADVKTVANCEKAKKLRNTLLKIGLPLVIIGAIGVIACFVFVAKSGFDMVDNTEFGVGFDISKFILPMVLFIVFGIMAAIGGALTSLALKIIITGYTTNLVDSAVGNSCPNCGDVIENDEVFCSKCGKAVKLTCTKCGQINNVKSEFCQKCGEKLNK